MPGPPAYDDAALSALPDGLPVPENDGAADRLPGLRLPSVVLAATDGRFIDLSAPGPLPRTVVYAYPRTGQPGESPLVEDWDQIPGARGCTPQACDFRDHHADLVAAGAELFGLSTQDSTYQREVVQRLRLPFPMLADPQLELAGALRLPTFQAGGQVLLRRHTLVIREGSIEHVFYPVFPPDGHAPEVIRWLREHPL